MAEIGSDKKKRLFVDVWDGDHVKCMRMAGYDGADSYLKHRAKKLLEDPHIIKAIEERDTFRENSVGLVASRMERQAWWTSIMRNEDPHKKPEFDSNGLPIPEKNIPLAQRMKASEYLGKSEADFVDRVDINHNVTISDLVTQSFQIADDASVEEIEAEYYRRKKVKEVQNETAEKVAEDKPSLGDFL